MRAASALSLRGNLETIDTQGDITSAIGIVALCREPGALWVKDNVTVIGFVTTECGWGHAPQYGKHMLCDGEHTDMLSGVTAL